VKSKIVRIDEVGDVAFRTSRRARHLNIRIRPGGSIVVSMPSGMPLRMAQDIVKGKTDWILRTLRKAKDRQPALLTLHDGSEIRTRLHVVCIRCGVFERLRISTTGSLVEIRVPATVSLSAPELQNAVRMTLIEIYRQEAKQILPPRVRALAAAHGFTINRVSIKNTKSRWGSCSAKNNINLSLHLMRVPDELVDYVILHELVHTEIMNHSPAFWRRLSELCPFPRRMQARLRKYEDPFFW
jgi:predicted metal-dependent hydrolase